MIRCARRRRYAATYTAELDLATLGATVTVGYGLGCLVHETT
jgi:hypothetical protein